MPQHSTEELLNILNEVNSLNGLRDFTSQTRETDCALTFSEYLSAQLKKNGMSAGELFRQANIQRNYGYQILNGRKKPGRDKAIALCLALSLSLEEVQHALTIAGLGTLYPRTQRDAIIIYGIQHSLRVTDVNQILYDMEETPLE